VLQTLTIPIYNSELVGSSTPSIAKMYLTAAAELGKDIFIFGCFLNNELRPDNQQEPAPVEGPSQSVVLTLTPEGTVEVKGDRVPPVSRDPPAVDLALPSLQTNKSILSISDGTTSNGGTP